MPNQRKGLPANWTWREGKPRWTPSPNLRKAGWKAGNLLDPAGKFLSHGASIDRANEINAAVAAWRAGGLVEARFQTLAPGGATQAPRASLAPADAFSIGALHDAYVISPELTRKKGRTVTDRRNKLKRLFDTLAGWVVLPDPGDAAAQGRYAADLATLRAASIFTLEPEEADGQIVDLLYNAYWALHARAGVAMAAGALVAASAWLTWCHKRKSRTVKNWASEVERETPPGRVRVMTWPEIGAMVAAADALAMPYVGDAIVLAIDLSWSQSDVLALTWARARPGEDGRRRADTGQRGRQKTGNVGAPPFLSMGKRRLAAIEQRQEKMDARPLKVIHIPRTRARLRQAEDSDASYFRKRYADVRAHAAQAVPSCASLTFADTRDTGFTLGRQAGLGDDQTASRTLQSRKNVASLGDKHYGEIGREIADQAADLMDPYVEAQIAKYGVKL